jgi:hypothetical protein
MDDARQRSDMRGEDDAAMHVSSQLSLDSDIHDNPPEANGIEFFCSCSMTALEINKSSKNEQDEEMCSFVRKTNKTESGFPLNPRLIKKHQDQDKTSKKLIKSTNGKDSTTREIKGAQLVHRKDRTCVL